MIPILTHARFCRSLLPATHDGLVHAMLFYPPGGRMLPYSRVSGALVDLMADSYCFAVDQARAMTRGLEYSRPSLS